MMYTVECPVETLKYYDRKFLTNTFFNSSATYRLDSDVYMPHDALTKITPKTPKEYIWDQKDVLAKVKNKTKFVFQAISHCNSESGRDIITKRMSELIKLDLVGDCYGVYCDLECYNRELGCSGRSSTIENKLKMSGGGSGINKFIPGNVSFPVACQYHSKNLKAKNKKEYKISEDLPMNQEKFTTNEGNDLIHKSKRK